MVGGLIVYTSGHKCYQRIYPVNNVTKSTRFLPGDKDPGPQMAGAVLLTVLAILSPSLVGFPFLSAVRVPDTNRKLEHI